MKDQQNMIDVLPVGAIVPFAAFAENPDGFIDVEKREITKEEFPDLYSILSDLLDSIDESLDLDSDAMEEINYRIVSREGGKIMLNDASKMGLAVGIGKEYDAVDAVGFRWVIKAFRSPDPNIENHAEGKIS